MNSLSQAPQNLSTTFASAAEQQVHEAKKKRPSPFCIRLSEEERAYLEEKAGGKPLGAYIRQQLLGDRAAKRRKQRKPSVDDKQVAALLASIGHSRVSANLNQLARAVNMGTLDVSRDTEQQLLEATEAVLAMRSALFIALGLKPEDIR